jgi:tetratricopeptide (TPR) repeat protein
LGVSDFELPVDDRCHEEVAMMLSALGVALFLLTAPVVTSDLEDAFQSLKQAEAKKDPNLIKKLATELYASAEKVICAPAPQGDTRNEDWANEVSYAKELQLYSEYALYAAALQSSPEVAVDLMATLEQENSKSKYLDEGYGLYLRMLHEAGGDAKVPSVAERALQNFPNNEDVLMLLAENALTQNQGDRALGYAKRVLAALSQHEKPEDISAADWERKRNMELGRAYWIAGVIQGEKSLYAEANKSLRSALPLISDNQAMLGPALFYLGVANYQLGVMTFNKPQVLEGAKYSEQAASIPGPYTEQAWRNAQLIKAAADKIR